jgi:hypothetical protein
MLKISPFAGRESPCAQVVEKATEAVVEPRIPLSPVVAPGNNAEYVAEVKLL